MHSSASSSLAALFVALLTTTAITPAFAQCDGETTSLFCYTADNGTPQDVNTTDVQFAASYLRSYGAQTRAGRLLTMTAALTPNCDEWTLYTHGTVLVTAKHINNTVDTSVLFADIATTIDGGPNATAEQKANAIIGCGADGGSLGVVVNTTNPTYHSSSYPAGNMTNGILIKVVANLAFCYW